MLLILESITNIYQNNTKEIHRFVKFSLVGAIGTIIDFTLLIILRDRLDWPLFWANTVSVSAAIISNFIWNRYWTFPESRVRKKRKQLPQFALVNIIGLLINNFILVGMNAILISHIGKPLLRLIIAKLIALGIVIGEPLLRLSIAKLVAIGIVLLWNFGINRLWTYKGL